jgi:hypothetical protein
MLVEVTFGIGQILLCDGCKHISSFSNGFLPQWHNRYFFACSHLSFCHSDENRRGMAVLGIQNAFSDFPTPAVG